MSYFNSDNERNLYLVIIFYYLIILKMKYDCWLECTEGEKLSLTELLREIKEYRLIEISLENGLAVRQWKDIPIMWEADDGAVFHMEYGMLYCTHGQDIISVWHRGDDLKEWLDICREYI